MKNILMLTLLFVLFALKATAVPFKAATVVGPFDVVVPMLYSDPDTTDRIAGQLYYNTQDSTFKGVNKNGGLDILAVAGSSSVTSGGTERIERVSISESGACTSTPCTITSQSGTWLSSVSRTSTGTYSLNINSGVFSAAPTCVIVSSQPNNLMSNNGTSTAFSFQTFNSSMTNTDAQSIRIICMGPR